MKYFVTGDTHGSFTSLLWKLADIKKLNPNEPIGIIILGDAGLNWHCNEKDNKTKRKLQESGYYFYLVRGNHEERPEVAILNVEMVYLRELGNEVYIEPEFPSIRYLIDGYDYWFNNYHCGVIGGAYSVDKHYRLSLFPKEAKWTGWFADEQLSLEEREAITAKWKEWNEMSLDFDCIFSHTCPYDWRPTDLFLSTVNQDEVDNSMELWLNELKEIRPFKLWCFGHFHADRAVNEKAIMLYNTVIGLDTLAQFSTDPTLRSALSQYLSN